MLLMNGYMTHSSNVKSDIVTGFYPFHLHCMYVLVLKQQLRCVELLFIEKGDIMLFLLQFQYVARGMWVHPLNNLRFEKGKFYTHYPDLRHFLAKFFTMYRMNIAKFDNLLLRVAACIAPKKNQLETLFLS